MNFKEKQRNILGFQRKNQGTERRASRWRPFPDEETEAQGLVNASSLLDLFKAYELFRHGLAQRVMRSEGFPLAIGRLELDLYGGPRRISIGGAVSREFQVITSLLAGSVNAGRILKCLLLPVVRTHIARWQGVNLFVMYDDCTLQRGGTELEVVHQLASATVEFIGHLEGYLGAKVNRAKS